MLGGLIAGDFAGKRCLVCLCAEAGFKASALGVAAFE